MHELGTLEAQRQSIEMAIAILELRAKNPNLQRVEIVPISANKLLAEGKGRLDTVGGTVHFTGTISDVVEEMMHSSGKVYHVDELLERLAGCKIQVTRKNLLNILNRWVRQGSRFARPAPNTFTLLEKKPRTA